MMRCINVSFQSGRSEDVVGTLNINQNFPPMMAWKDQREDYLMVSDDEERPDLQKKRSLVIPAGVNLDLEIQCKDSSPSRNRWEKVSEGKDEMHKCVAEYTIEASGGYVDYQRRAEHIQKVDYSRVKEVKTVNILLLDKENSSGYMDVQRQTNIPEDYSKVKEVTSDNMVFLQQQSVSLDTTNCTKHKPVNPHVSGLRLGACTELTDSGYVDTTPAFWCISCPNIVI